MLHCLTCCFELMFDVAGLSRHGLHHNEFYKSTFVTFVAEVPFESAVGASFLLVEFRVLGLAARVLQNPAVFKTFAFWGAQLARRRPCSAMFKRMGVPAATRCRRNPSVLKTFAF